MPLLAERVARIEAILASLEVSQKEQYRILTAIQSGILGDAEGKNEGLMAQVAKMQLTHAMCPAHVKTRAEQKAVESNNRLVALTLAMLVINVYVLWKDAKQNENSNGQTPPAAYPVTRNDSGSGHDPQSSYVPSSQDSNQTRR